MPLKLECHLNWNVTQIRVSLKYECPSNLKTKFIEKVVNPKTSMSASRSNFDLVYIKLVQKENDLFAWMLIRHHFQADGL